MTPEVIEAIIDISKSLTAIVFVLGIIGGCLFVIAIKARLK
jgi:hypothetical protein